ncbi:MAG: DUF4402 domain-containing protein [Salegentibacter sp.]|uniref:DUF4402 domain-containing protein n=1 Tax=Salegentibacter flavus TaxID=287099 RepID=A0A1I4Y5V0_9FLAO|nr:MULTISPECIES: DUF4402 domain-containing protein [Salegentibacter]MDR9458468.1 DUF4402 domain-containing protein [Salegentibacter sp.]SFN33397.1 protein of unknown function [Salegentibacter flavus]
MKTNYLKILTILILLLAGGACFAQASATANFKASVTIIEPIGITTTSDMNFANIDARNGGTVILKPDNTRVATGGLELEEAANVSAATFMVTGQQGYSFNISLPQGSYELRNGGEAMAIQDFTAELDQSLLGDGPAMLKVGASLFVNPNQEPGVYNSVADLQVTVNYN